MTDVAKLVSVLTGAISLQDAFPSIVEVGNIGQNKSYAEVALRARKLWMQESMPNLEQSKNKILEAAKQLMESDSKKPDELFPVDEGSMC